jgi:hypothetical protein
LGQVNTTKQQVEQELAQVKLKVTGKETLKGAKHMIWDQISTIFHNWSQFKLIQEEFELIMVVFKDIKKISLQNWKASLRQLII